MRDITIHNFRCYEEKTMEFRPGINLLIGDNSVGKTSLLRACNLVLNSFFAGFSDEYTVWKSPENDDFREVGSSDTLSTNDLPISISFHLSESDLHPIRRRDASSYDFDYSQELVLEKRSKKNSRNLITRLQPIVRYAKTLQMNGIEVRDGEAEQLNPLPLFASYTTEDIHSKRKFDKDKKKFNKYPHKPTFGYIECFDSKGLLDCWIKRMLVLREAKKGEVEIANVRAAVLKALGKEGCNIISDIDIRPNDGEVFFILADGREVRTELLSDGYRRLVSIVVDLAIRCALLNKTIYGEEAYMRTHGTAIIDEIDEHQHPSLQVRVLKALRNTFPKIQFIISTHSPLVISSVESNDDNVVYKLNYDEGSGAYTHEELNAYGMDASTIIKCYMDEPSRDLNIDGQIKKIEDLIDGERYAEAKELLAELRNMTKTDDPEFSYISSMKSILL